MYAEDDLLPISGFQHCLFCAGPLSAIFKTLTFDNGKEFCGHEAIAAALGVSVYFARPCHSWERGLNENTNELIRQYFPRKMPLKNISIERVKKVQDLLNHRPRKILGYLPPHEVLVEWKPTWV